MVFSDSMLLCGNSDACKPAKQTWFASGPKRTWCSQDSCRVMLLATSLQVPIVYVQQRRGRPESGRQGRTRKRPLEGGMLIGSRHGCQAVTGEPAGQFKRARRSTRLQGAEGYRVQGQGQGQGQRQGQRERSAHAPALPLPSYGAPPEQL